MTLATVKSTRNISVPVVMLIAERATVRSVGTHNVSAAVPMSSSSVLTVKSRGGWVLLISSTSPSRCCRGCWWSRIRVMISNVVLVSAKTTVRGHEGRLARKLGSDVSSDSLLKSISSKVITSFVVSV